MRQLQKFSAAIVIAGLVGTSLTVFSTPAYTSTTSTSRNAAICQFLERSEAAIAGLPAGPLKTFLEKYVLPGIEKAEAQYGLRGSVTTDLRKPDEVWRARRTSSPSALHHIDHAAPASG